MTGRLSTNSVHRVLVLSGYALGIAKSPPTVIRDHYWILTEDDSADELVHDPVSDLLRDVLAETDLHE